MLWFGGDNNYIYTLGKSYMYIYWLRSNVVKQMNFTFFVLSIVDGDLFSIVKVDQI